MHGDYCAWVRLVLGGSTFDLVPLPPAIRHLAPGRQRPNRPLNWRGVSALLDRALTQHLRADERSAARTRLRFARSQLDVLEAIATRLDCHRDA